jgi:hydrocephalus-inducing protein
MASQQSGASTANMINSNVFYVEEKVFHFGTLVPSKIPDGIVEKFKIQNNNKVPCTVKFDARKKTPTSVEQFAFEVEPKQVKIPPHEHCYVNVTFKPTIMAMYSGMFEAVVENGEQNTKTHKLVFDLRGEGALPTIKLEKPKEYFDERTVLVKFSKTRVGKATSQQICLKNDGVIPATVKWDLPANDSFRFLDSINATLNPKGYATFNVEFKPKDVGAKNWDISAQTLLNQFEVTRFKIQG